MFKVQSFSCTLYVYSSPKVYHNCFSKKKQKCLVKTNPMIKTFDAIIPIRCHGIKGNNSDVFWFIIDSG